MWVITYDGVVGFVVVVLVVRGCEGLVLCGTELVVGNVLVGDWLSVEDVRTNVMVMLLFIVLLSCEYVGVSGMGTCSSTVEVGVLLGESPGSN